MNFLLHMIGMSKQSDVTLRPTPRQLLLQTAAAAAVEGQFAEALRAMQGLAEICGGHRSVTELLFRAHLHLAAGENTKAGHYFSAGIARLKGECDASSFVSEFKDMLCAFDGGSELKDRSGDYLERIIELADGNLRQGRYVRATELFQRARTMVDTLISGQAGMILADARAEGRADARMAQPLVGLAKLGDLLLRMLARTHLAANVAAGLRQRSLREDLATWATTGEDVEELLRAEFAAMIEGTRRNPDHAEMHYRLGLVARAIGEMTIAEKAFTRVVQLHPHHVLAATRLGATLLQNKKEEAVMPLLAVAFAVPAEVLKQYAGLAEAAGDRPAFEQAVARLCHDLGGKPDTTTVRANLAFALGELGLLDEERAAWREAMTVS